MTPPHALPPVFSTHQVKGLLEIVSAASEFDTLPLRPGEETVVQKMISHAPVAVDKPRFSDPHTKVNALLQAHFSRERLSGDLGNDTRTAVREAARLLQVGTELAQPVAAVQCTALNSGCVFYEETRAACLTPCSVGALSASRLGM